MALKDLAMETYTKDSTFKAKSKDKEFTFGAPVRNTKESGMMAIRRVMVYGTAFLVIPILDNGMTISPTDLVSILGATVTFTKENGKLVSDTVKALTCSPWVIAT